jgi:hypothetical protein
LLSNTERERLGSPECGRITAVEQNGEFTD